MNYLSSHDDGSPFDPDRTQPKMAGTMLLLAPGAAQIYYGDELARPLRFEGASGDAHLRTYMNWEDLEGQSADVFDHWAKLGQFRERHVSIGAGVHQKLSDSPYTFSRVYADSENGGTDAVVIALNAEGNIAVGDIFEDGSLVRDAYSGNEYTVEGGQVALQGASEVVLLESADISI